MQLHYEATLGSPVLQNIVIRNGKKHSHNKVFDNYLGFPTQADHYLKRSLYPYVSFFLFSCFSSGKFEKTLVTCNVQKSDLFVFSFLTKEQKRKIPHFSII